MKAYACWYCIFSLHDECISMKENKDGVLQCCCASKLESKEKDSNPVGRPLSDPKDIKDIKSTGRKRAAMLYPIQDGMKCEWARLLHAGGGVFPITGCRGNIIDSTKHGPTAGHRHHGPNKNVFDNSPLNVHRICTTCHNRWHALNNKTYEGERPQADEAWYPTGDWLPHNPVSKAEEKDFIKSDKYWSKRSVEDVDTVD